MNTFILCMSTPMPIQWLSMISIQCASMACTTVRITFGILVLPYYHKWNIIIFAFKYM